MQQLVNHKVNSLTTSDLLQLAQQHQIPVTQQQAEHVLHIVHSEKINVANTEQIHRILHRLQTEVDPHVASRHKFIRMTMEVQGLI